MPQHNRVTKQMNQTLINKVCSMLDDSGLLNLYWFNAIVYTLLLHIVTPTHALNDITPNESWSGNKPDVSCLHIFGSHTHMHIPDNYQKKLSAKSLTCTFIGYAENHKAFLLVHCQSCQYYESHDVIFNKGGMFHQNSVALARTFGSNISLLGAQIA